MALTTKRKEQEMNTLNEPKNDLVHYTKNPNSPVPDITGWDDWCGVRPSLDESGTYLLAPVAKVVEVEIPEETKPVEPYVGLEWSFGDIPRRVLALFEHKGMKQVVLSVGPGMEGEGLLTETYAGLFNRCNYPTTTTPPRKEKRLVMLNGWTREGFGDSV